MTTQPVGLMSPRESFLLWSARSGHIARRLAPKFARILLDDAGVDHAHLSNPSAVAAARIHLSTRIDISAEMARVHQRIGLTQLPFGGAA